MKVRLLHIGPGYNEPSPLGNGQEGTGLVLPGQVIEVEEQTAARLIQAVPAWWRLLAPEGAEQSVPLSQRARRTRPTLKGKPPEPAAQAIEQSQEGPAEPASQQAVVSPGGEGPPPAEEPTELEALRRRVLGTLPASRGR